MKLTGSGVMALVLLLGITGSGIWGQCQRTQRIKAQAALAAEQHIADSLRADTQRRLAEQQQHTQQLEDSLAVVDAVNARLVATAAQSQAASAALAEQLSQATTAADSLPIVLVQLGHERNRASNLLLAFTQQQQSMERLRQDRDDWRALALDSTEVHQLRAIIVKQAHELIALQDKQCDFLWCPSKVELLLIGIVIGGVAATAAQ